MNLGSEVPLITVGWQPAFVTGDGTLLTVPAFEPWISFVHTAGRCAADPSHEPPAPECTCGLLVDYTAEEAYARLRRMAHELSVKDVAIPDLALLRVKAIDGTKVVMHDFGFRAQTLVLTHVRLLPPTRADFDHERYPVPVARLRVAQRTVLI